MDGAEFVFPRQRFVLSAGLALVAAALAACTVYGKKQAATGSGVAAPNTSGASAPAPGAPGSSGPAPGKSGSSAPANAIAKTSDVPVGSGVIVGNIVLTQPSSGVFKGLSATCTHAGCTVSDVSGGTINCPCHGSKYHLDGSVAEGPAVRSLSAKAISVVGDSIVPG
jgi:Rieske Fe-S protein